MHRLKILRVGLICSLFALLSLSQPIAAHGDEAACDVQALLAHQSEHAQELADLQTLAETDLDAALTALYRTGVAYQALAVECGFADGSEVATAHEAEHSDDHNAEKLEIARSVGDPENGEILFNTFQDAVAFACATCHRVDTTERLIGPGLLGVGGATHDHSAHAADPMAGMPGMEATAEPAGHEHHDEATPAPTRTLEETVAYLHTSIVDPSAYLVPEFPDGLMPQVYKDVFTEDEINDLIAYLLTL